MAADPTLELLRALDDPRQYTRKEGVPIWVPHTRIVMGEDGKPRAIRVEEADLPAYAEDIRRREVGRGVLGRITDGHVKPDKVMDNGVVVTFPKPKLLGYYRNPRVGFFGQEKVPAVLVDCYYRNDCLPVVSERPYRSPEVYTEQKSIKGLALLLNDPYLDMGTTGPVGTQYEVVARPVCYGGEHMPGAMGPANGTMPEPVGKDAPAVPDKDKPDDKGKGDKKPEDFKPEEKELFEKAIRYMRGCYGLHEEWPKEGKKPDAPAPDAKADEHTDPAMKKPDEVQAMSTDKVPELYEKKLADIRTDYEAKFARLNEALAAERSRNDGLALERDQERCLTMLATALPAINYSLSDDERKREVAKLAGMKPEDRPERVKELKAIYADREIPGGKLDLYHGPVEGGDQSASVHAAPWYHESALQYMRLNVGTSYEKAVEVIQAAGKK